MLRSLTLCILAPVLTALGQSASPSATFQPHNPKDYFDAAAPSYDFNDAALKPWHLKATYQTYDDSSAPKEHGTFEHWWVSPQIYRNSWTRPGATHNVWHTADGKHAYRGEGVLDYFEYALRSAILSPLPEPAELDPSKYRLEQDSVKISAGALQCVMVIPLMPQHGRIQQVPLGLFPTYCFSAGTPILRVEYSWGSMVMAFDKIAKVQGRYLARQISIFENKRKILTASVDLVEGLSPQDPALIPPPDAPSSSTNTVQLASGITTGMLLKKETPVYPQDAKDANISGTVTVQATIGRDGGVHDLRILSTPWPSLAASALRCVSHWRYKPYLLDGEPVEVETKINVIYTLGR
ncbi:energy transducer TonB [Telmatobacter sp. DSM 110680]|uniref:Energy transducer TonB n=1 Tax=Telmatobacter sp. DSM 110680 TaxID=3036704 RepID=A0AAU7DKN1_9BACT